MSLFCFLPIFCFAPLMSAVDDGGIETPEKKQRVGTSAEMEVSGIDSGLESDDGFQEEMGSGAAVKCISAEAQAIIAAI